MLPGILGSRLERDGRVVWGFGSVVRSLTHVSARLTADLSLDATAFTDPERGCDDGTVAARVMGSLPPRPGIRSFRAFDGTAAAIPGFWTLVDGYDLLLQRLKTVVDPRDVVAFPYDWRQSCRVTATRLRSAVEPLMRARRREHPAAQLILIGHSLGGLVAQYYAECLDDEGFTGRVISIGTPYQGAVRALTVLANGSARVSAGPVAIRVEVGELLRSMPSVAECLPIYPCIGDDAVALTDIRDGNAVPGLPRRLADHATTFHREIEAAAASNGNRRPIYSPILSVMQMTPKWAKVSSGRVEEQCAADGDGTVARLSAIPHDWVDPGGGMFAAGKHAGLQNSTGAWDQVFGLLTGGAPRRPMAAAEELMVDAPEYVMPGGDWTVTARPVSGNMKLAVVAECDAPSGILLRTPLRPGTGSYSATLTIDEPGIVRWTLRADPMGNAAVSPVSDVLVCAEP